MLSSNVTLCTVGSVFHSVITRGVFRAKCRLTQAAISLLTQYFVLFTLYDGGPTLKQHWLCGALKHQPSTLRINPLCATLFCVNPLTAELFNWNFHPLEVVSRWRDPQLQVSKNYSDSIKWRSTVFKYCWLISHFIFNMFKRWYLMR